MQAQADDAFRLRLEGTSLIDALSQLKGDPSLGMPCLVARTKAISRYPTTAQAFYACGSISVLGAEVEGASGTLSVGPATFLALNLGSAVPPVGSNLLVTFVENRWVFRYDG